MKRTITILIVIILTVPVMSQQHSEWIKSRKTTWKKTALNMGISIASVALEMSGDALFDMGKDAGNVTQMQWGHTLQAAGYGALLSIPLLQPTARDIPVIAVNYLCIRFTFADAIYNSVRGLPLLYSGTTSEHDNFMSTIPPDGRAFLKTISFGFAFSVNIKYW